MKAALNPYLNFMGTTKQAMEFYHSVLGGELEMHTFGEYGAPVKDKDGIMHAVLKNDALTFMAADGNEHHQVTMGDNISMSLSGDDAETLTKYFNGLAEGGKVDMPLAKQVWGDTFGMLTDKFGVHWMVNIVTPKPAEK
jgi:PhnB protein